MESLSTSLSSPPIFSKNPKTPKFTKSKPISLFTNLKLTPKFINPISRYTTKKTQSLNPIKPNLKTLSFLFLDFPFPLSSIASEISSIEIPTNQESTKINLEAIVVSIDDFFNKYPFFVAGCVFIWLWVIPASQEYFRKYKLISAIDAFKKLKDDPNAQLLDIREKKTVWVLGSPNLKILNKNSVNVEFLEGDDEDFVKKVKESFKDPANTTICILDNFEGDSMKVAELLFNNGFKEAYAIRGGVRGNNGWQEIQENLLPPSVHIYPKTKVKKSKELNNNGTLSEQSEVKGDPDSIADSEQTNNGYVNTSTGPNSSLGPVARSLSPYPMYPDLKPPSSPTPSKPQ